MSARGVTTRDRGDRRSDRRHRGRSVAERALGQIRLVAVALVVVGGAGYRPSEDGGLSRDIGLPLAGGAAALLLAVAILTSRASRAASGRPSQRAAGPGCGGGPPPGRAAGAAPRGAAGPRWRRPGRSPTRSSSSVSWRWPDSRRIPSPSC